MKTTKRPKAKFTKSALADALGISRQALNVHLKSPDAPQVDDLTGWQVFIAAHGREGTAPPDLRRAIAQERLEILRETKAKLARENAVANAELMPVMDAKRQNHSAWCFVFDALERLEREQPPALAGLSAVEIGERLHTFTEMMRKEAQEKFEKPD